MDPIKEALTFDDVTMAPKYSEVLPSEVDTSTRLSSNLILKMESPTDYRRSGMKMGKCRQRRTIGMESTMA